MASLSLSLSLSLEIMGRSINSSCWVFIVAILVIPRHSLAGSNRCKPSWCGNFNISYPFRLQDDPKHCGQLLYTLSCENNMTLVDLPSSGKYYVQSIHYHNQTISLIDPNLLHNSTVPRNLIPAYYMSAFPYTVVAKLDHTGFHISTPVFFIKCLNPPVNSSLYVSTAPCNNISDAHGYFKIGNMELGDLNEGCSLEWMASTFLNISDDYNKATCKSIHDALSYGFQVQYFSDDELVMYYKTSCRGQWTYSGICFRRSLPGLVGYLLEDLKEYFASGQLAHINLRWIPINITMVTRWVPLVGVGLYLLARLILGSPLVIAFLIYKWRRRHLSMYTNIEDFLHNDNIFGPIRYSYSDVKKMTNRFKHKLGKGGYGSVFKGKLRSGHFGAIKLLGNFKTNGQDFISEVATIGRIHHTNVVQLIGYCVEGSKRALVYDFMPNGSLDKYIYSKEGSIPLSFKQMYEISLGVAQGIEYLHQGCDMQILHFDIKPHNILLDQNFIPKISDFGLAKLYPTDNSIVSLTAARGTMGCIVSTKTLEVSHTKLMSIALECC